jgi:outer membrane protein, heavy metal efflux system
VPIRGAVFDPYLYLFLFVIGLFDFMKQSVFFIRRPPIAILSILAGSILASIASTGGEIATLPPASSNSLIRLSVEEAVSLALTNNPEFLGSGGRIDAASGRAYQARRWRNPELSLATEDIPLGSGSFRDSKDTLGLTQTIPYPGKKRLDGQIGAADVRSSKADWHLRRQELTRDVKIAYFRVLAADRLVEVSRELVQVASASATAARKRVEAGATADQEQLRAEIQMSQAQN